MEELKNTLYATTIEELKNDIGEGGVEAAAKKILEAAKITPIYDLEQRDPAAFAESRHRLNSEPGLIIANHPGYYDTFAILNALKRKDVKIIVSGGNYENFGPSIGEDLLIKAAENASEAFAFLKAIKSHIESGGVVLLYPSGGADRVDKENKDFAFENGLSVILRRCLKPTDMVYSFYINPNDIEVLADEKIPRVAGVISTVTMSPSLNVNKLKESAEIGVDERYSTAQEWQEIADASDKETRNRALAHHFAETLNI